MNPATVLNDAKLRELDSARAEAYWRRFSELAKHDDAITLKRFSKQGARDLLAFAMAGFERVIGLDENNADLLDDAIAWMQEQGHSPSFDLLPLESLADVRAALAQQGWWQKRHQSLLFGAPQPELDSPVHRSIAASEVDQSDAAELSDFLETFVDAHEIETNQRDQMVERIRRQYAHSHWQLFLVRVDGTPAGVGTMGRFGNVAYMSNSATVPRFRRQGVHRAVLHIRLQAAKDQGIPLIAADTPVNANSQRNIIRTGMSIACQWALWTK